MLGLFSPEANPWPPPFYLADPNGNTCWHLPCVPNAPHSTHDQQLFFFISCSVAQFRRLMILSSTGLSSWETIAHSKGRPGNQCPHLHPDPCPHGTWVYLLSSSLMSWLLCNLTARCCSTWSSSSNMVSFMSLISASLSDAFSCSFRLVLLSCSAW